MNEKMFEVVAAVVFLVIALAHLARWLMGTSILVGGIGVPMWASGVAAVLFLYLGWEAIRLRRKAGLGR
jgi:hypothetical protein